MHSQTDKILFIGPRHLAKILKQNEILRKIMSNMRLLTAIHQTTQKGYWRINSTNIYFLLIKSTTFLLLNYCNWFLFKSKIGKFSNSMIDSIEGNKSCTSFNSECSLLVGKGFPQTIYHKLDRFPAESREKHLGCDRHSIH